MNIELHDSIRMQAAQAKVERTRMAADGLSIMTRAHADYAQAQFELRVIEEEEKRRTT